MSRVRVHNFSISLDGFGTGDGLSLEVPFGHAGHRLHEWMFATRFWDAAGTARVDNAFAERHEHGIGAQIMGTGNRQVRPSGLAERPAGHMVVRGLVGMSVVLIIALTVIG